MEFSDYVQNGLAILGGLYVAARAIVAITPTPKDNAILNKTWSIVLKVAGLFGLDPTQGLQANETADGDTDSAK